MRFLEKLFHPRAFERRGSRRGLRDSRGFTLIELMVVVSIITISATITFASINTDKYQVAFENFSEELGAEMMKARDLAINEQATVMVRIAGDGIAVTLDDPETGAQVPLRVMHKRDFGGGRLGNDVCIVGVFPLLYAPSRAIGATIPQTGCQASAGNATIAAVRFGPDGAYEVATAAGEGSTINGWTVVARDQRAARPEFSLIELYPTGMIRVVPHIRDGSE